MIRIEKKGRARALRSMVLAYADNALANTPVAEWKDLA